MTMHSVPGFKACPVLDIPAYHVRALGHRQHRVACCGKHPERARLWKTWHRKLGQRSDKFRVRIPAPVTCLGFHRHVLDVLFIGLVCRDGQHPKAGPFHVELIPRFQLPEWQLPYPAQIDAKKIVDRKPEKIREFDQVNRRRVFRPSSLYGSEFHPCDA